MQETSSASITDPLALIRTQERHDDDPRNPSPVRIEAPEARDKTKTKAQKAADIALDALDTLASSMASIGKVTGVPYLAESAGLVVTIIDIVAKMKGNKEKFESLVRRTANIISIIYEEVVQKGAGMNEELKRNVRNVHDQLQQIKKFCKRKVKEGRLLRALRRKSDADAIEEYEKRLTQALSDFNFRSHIGHSVVLDGHSVMLNKIHRCVTAGQAAHRADGNVAPDALAEDQTEPPREDPRRAARLEEDRMLATTRRAEEPERQAGHTTTTAINTTNGVQGRIENESLAGQSGAQGDQGREDFAAGDVQRQQRVWREPRVDSSEIMGTREEGHIPEESYAQALENGEDEAGQSDRRLPPARVEEHFSTTTASLPADALPRRPRSWNLPDQPLNTGYPSPPPQQRNPDNNPFRNPDVLQRSKSGAHPRVARDDIRQSTRRAHTQSAGYDPGYGYAGDYYEPYYPSYATPPTSRFPTSPHIQMNGGYNVNSGNVGSTFISNSFNGHPAGHTRDKYRS